MSLTSQIVSDMLRHSVTAMEIAKKYHTSKGVSRISDARRDPQYKHLTFMDAWVNNGRVRYKRYWAVMKKGKK